MELKPYQQRVVNEKNEIDMKIEKLSVFSESREFNDLETPDKELLLRQGVIMWHYSKVLQERIDRFK